MTGAIRKYLAENPSHFDPRQYLKPAREEMKKMYIHKIVNVLGSPHKNKNGSRKRGPFFRSFFVSLS